MKKNALAGFILALSLILPTFVATLFAAPVGLQISQQSTNLLLSWPTNYSAFNLQYSTNLNGTNWTTVAGAVLQGNRFEAQEPLGAATRFYRLLSPCATNADPYLPGGTFLTLNGSSITSTNLTNMVSSLTFNASAFVDPSSCAGNGGLTYAWQALSGITPLQTNISGQSSPVFVITTNGLASGIYAVNLAVTGSSGRTTNLALALMLTNPPVGCLPPSSHEYPSPEDKSSVSHKPYLPEGSHFVVNNIPLMAGTSSFPATSTTYYNPLTHILYIGPVFPFSTQVDPYSFIDASGVIDPATCDSSTLTYQWQINHATLGGDLRPFGVVGYNTPRLKVAFQALVNGLYDVHLFVTGASGTSEFVFEFEVIDSNAQFRTPCTTNTTPYLPSGNFVTLNGNSVPSTFQLKTNVSSVVLNASGFVSVYQECTAEWSRSALSYHWTLAPSSTNTFTGSVSGTNTSILTIPRNSLAAGTYVFRLIVTDSFDGSTQMDFPVRFFPPCDLLPDPAIYPVNPGTNPFLPAGSHLIVNNIPMLDGDTALLADFHPHLTFDLLGLFSTQGDPYSFLDVGAVIDPLSCDKSTLTYQWHLNGATLGTDLHPYGVAGFNSSRLRIYFQSLPNGFYDAHAVVTGVAGTSEFTFEFEVRDSNAGYLTPCSTNTTPYLPPGSSVTLNGNPIPTTFQLTTNVTSVVLNSGAFFEPHYCQFGGSALSHRWELAPGSAKTFTGSVSGTNTSALTIPGSSLTTGSYIFRLTVTSDFTDIPTVLDFPVTFTP